MRSNGVLWSRRPRPHVGVERFKGIPFLANCNPAASIAGRSFCWLDCYSAIASASRRDIPGRVLHLPCVRFRQRMQELLRPMRSSLPSTVASLPHFASTVPVTAGLARFRFPKNCPQPKCQAGKVCLAGKSGSILNSHDMTFLTQRRLWSEPLDSLRLSCGSLHCSTRGMGEPIHAV